MSKKRSPIWNFFTVSNEKVSEATCDICKTSNTSGSITNLKKHVNRRHPTIVISSDSKSCKSAITEKNESENRNNHSPSLEAEKGKSQQNSQVPRPKPKGSQTGIKAYTTPKLSINMKKSIDHALLKPFRIVEDKGFKEFVKILNPAYELPNRKQISKTLIELEYAKFMSEVQKIVEQISTCCLTTDCWTSCNNDSFIGITIYFINDEFELNSILITCETMVEQHTAENLAQKLREITEKWQLTNKIFSAVSDNAFNIKKAINHVGWEHFGCFAHTLNLIVKDALRIDSIKQLIEKIKVIVGHFKRSANAMHRFTTFQKNSGVEIPKKVLQDVPTRWNSTFYMLQRFVELEECIKATVAVLDVNLPHLSGDERNTVKEITAILKPFESATKAIEGEKYTSASLVIVLRNGLVKVSNQMMLTHNLSQPTLDALSKLINGLKERLGNVERSKTLALCTFLDPRFKDIAFEQSDDKEDVHRYVQDLLCCNMTSTPVVETPFSSDDNNTNTNSASDDTLSIWFKIDQEVKKLISKPTITAESQAIIQSQRYKEETMLPLNGDPLKWWAQRRCNYPLLSQLVREKLCAMATC